MEQEENINGLINVTVYYSERNYEVVRELCGVVKSEAVNSVLRLSTRGQPCQVRNCECSILVVYTRPAMSGQKL